MSRLSIVVAGLVLVCPLRAWGNSEVETAAPEPLELTRAVQLAKTRGVDLLLADAATRSASADVRIAGAVPNPAVSGTYGRTIILNSAQSACGDCSLNYWGVGLTDQAAIADSLSGKRGLRLDVARAAVRAAKLGRADAERILTASVKLEYVQLSLAEQNLQFSHDLQKLTAQTRDLVKTRFRAGAVSAADVARAETARLESDQAVDAAAGSLRAEQTNMAFLLGERGVVPNYDVDESRLEYQESARLQNLKLSELLQLARANRPDIQASEQQLQQAQASLSLARRQRVPDIALSVGYSQQGSGQNSQQPPMVTVGVSAPLPIFYQNQGEIAKAAASIDTQSLQHAKLLYQVNGEVTANFAAFRTARRRVLRMRTELLDQVKTAYNLVTVQYEKGAASLLELLDAQRAYASANLEYRQDLADYWSAVIRLEQSTGLEFVR